MTCMPFSRGRSLLVFELPADHMKFGALQKGRLLKNEFTLIPKGLQNRIKFAGCDQICRENLSFVRKWDKTVSGH